MHERLRARGWSERELAYLSGRFVPQKEARVLVLVALLLLAFAIVAVPYAYAVLGQLMVREVFYVTLVIIGVPLGTTFGLLLIDLDRLDHRHHLVLLVAVPLVGILASSYLLSVVYSSAPEGAHTHNALIGGIVYAVSFITPYAFLVKQEWTSPTGRWHTYARETR